MQKRRCYRIENKGGERFVLWTGLGARCLRIFRVEKNQVQNVVLFMRGRALYIGTSVLRSQKSERSMILRTRLRIQVCFGANDKTELLSSSISVYLELPDVYP